MIRVRFPHPDHGDIPEMMTALEAAEFIKENREKISVANFSELDEPVPLPDLPFLNTAELAKQLKEKDGEELVLYPKIGGG